MRELERSMERRERKEIDNHKKCDYQRYRSKREKEREAIVNLLKGGRGGRGERD